MSFLASYFGTGSIGVGFQTRVNVTVGKRDVDGEMFYHMYNKTIINFVCFVYLKLVGVGDIVTRWNYPCKLMRSHVWTLSILSLLRNTPDVVQRQPMRLISLMDGPRSGLLQGMEDKPRLGIYSIGYLASYEHCKT